MQLGSVFPSTYQLLSGSLNNRVPFSSSFRNSSTDAVTIALSTQLTADIGTLRQGSNNLYYGQSASDIAGTAMLSISDLNSRMMELATQSSNGLLSDSQRDIIDQEFQALAEEATRIAQNTEFNGQNLFNSSGFSIGSDSGQSVELSLGNTPSFVGLSVSTQGNAAAAMDALRANQGTISSSFAQIGASDSRLSTQLSSNESQIATKVGALELLSRRDAFDSITATSEKKFKTLYLHKLEQTFLGRQSTLNFLA